MSTYSASFSPAKDFGYYDALLQWPPSSAVVYTVISLLPCYYLCAYFKVLPFTFSGLLWNSIVFFTPSFIIMALDRGSGTHSTERDSIFFSTFEHFRAKSDAVQRILGFDSTSLLASLPAARKYSNSGPSLFGANSSNPAGLGNWDNSCYQNSIIQSLASVRALGEFLGHNVGTLGNRRALATHRALEDIIGMLNSPSSSGRKLWIPAELKSMSSWQQQDAQEYFSKVVEALDKEIRDASRGITDDLGLKIAGQPAETDNTTDKSSGAGKNKEPGTEIGSYRHAAPPVNPLEGLLAQRVGCMRCGWTEGLSLFPFNCLTVSLGVQQEYDIRECLDDYTDLEPIEGVECARCTLLRTETQLVQLLKQFQSDSGSDHENEPNGRGLSVALKDSAEARLEAVREALREEDFSEKTLSRNCHIPTKNRVSVTKSRQAVIARSPKSLAIHVNRSVFDEMTGLLRKNYAHLRFPKVLDLDEWCLGASSAANGGDKPENWIVEPSESMLCQPESTSETINGRRYELRAVITHYGRHENGHYICYRKYPCDAFPAPNPDALVDEEGRKLSEAWFRLSDEDVSFVSESTVLAQGGVFMLFYELMENGLSGEADEAGEAAESTVDTSVKVNAEVPQDLPFSHQRGTPDAAHSDESTEKIIAPEGQVEDPHAADTPDTSSTASSDKGPVSARTLPEAPRTDLPLRSSSNARSGHHDEKGPMSPPVAAATTNVLVSARS